MLPRCLIWSCQEYSDRARGQYYPDVWFGVVGSILTKLATGQHYPDVWFGVVGNVLTELQVSITQMSDFHWSCREYFNRAIGQYYPDVWLGVVGNVLTKLWAQIWRGSHHCLRNVYCTVQDLGNPKVTWHKQSGKHSLTGSNSTFSPSACYRCPLRLRNSTFCHDENSYHPLYLPIY